MHSFLKHWNSESGFLAISILNRRVFLFYLLVLKAKIPGDLRKRPERERERILHLIVCISFLQTYGALFCETSAKDGSNVVEAVLHLAR